jgi:hypothetical protein
LAVRHLWLARVAALATTEIRHPQLYVPDPTERLVSKIREFVEAHGARLMVGLQRSDDKLIQHEAERIPFVTFNDAEAYSDRFGAHWTPAGHGTATLPPRATNWSLSACCGCSPKTTSPTDDLLGQHPPHDRWASAHGQFTASALLSLRAGRNRA